MAAAKGSLYSVVANGQLISDGYTGVVTDIEFRLPAGGPRLVPNDALDQLHLVNQRVASDDRLPYDAAPDHRALPQAHIRPDHALANCRRGRHEHGRDDHTVIADRIDAGVLVKQVMMRFE